MKKLLYLSALSMVVTLLMASAALAQDTGGSSVYCPEGGFPATPAGSPGEGGLTCFDTEEEANYYSETGELLPEQTSETPTPTGTQYETTTTPETPVAQPTEPALPNTGGPALLMPVAGLLLATGLVGMRVVRRRS